MSLESIFNPALDNRLNSLEDGLSKLKEEIREMQKEVGESQSSTSSKLADLQTQLTRSSNLHSEFSEQDKKLNRELATLKLKAKEIERLDVVKGGRLELLFKADRIKENALEAQSTAKTLLQKAEDDVNKALENSPDALSAKTFEDLLKATNVDVGIARSNAQDAIDETNLARLSWDSYANVLHEHFELVQRAQTPENPSVY